jgi:hypothetical protein
LVLTGARSLEEYARRDAELVANYSALASFGRASNAEKQPTSRGPEGCVENGLAAALLVGYVSNSYSA